MDVKNNYVIQINTNMFNETKAIYGDINKKGYISINWRVQEKDYIEGKNILKIRNQFYFRGCIDRGKTRWYLFQNTEGYFIQYYISKWEYIKYKLFGINKYKNNSVSLKVKG